MRVIGGTWGGRRLLGPPRGAETRPTSDRVREAIFNITASSLEGARVLDLFAGTGALGVGVDLRRNAWSGRKRAAEAGYA